MAVSLLAYEVSDLCIGKPALNPLLLPSSVAGALRTLRRFSDPYLSVWSTTTANAKPASAYSAVCVGKVCVVDIICFLCSDENLPDPSSALKSPLSALLPSTSSSLVRTIDPRSSVLEALDLILEGAQNLVVPIRSSPRKKKNAGDIEFCWLTQEDFVRFFLNSIGLFSPVPALSVDILGIIRQEVLAVRYHDSAISAVGLVRQAALTQTAVAVVTDDGKLMGEISPSTLAFFGGGEESVAAAVATLSAGEFIAYIDCGGPPSGTVKERLKERNLKGMLDLVMEAEEREKEELEMGGRGGFCFSSPATSSSDEESPREGKRKGGSGGKRKYARMGSYSARMGRRSEEAIVCHPGSSLVAVTIQALAHRVGYVWVVEEDYGLAGVVVLPDMLKVFRDHLVVD